MHFFLAIFQYKHKVIEKRFVEVKDNVNSWDINLFCISTHHLCYWKINNSILHSLCSVHRLQPISLFGKKVNVYGNNNNNNNNSQIKFAILLTVKHTISVFSSLICLILYWYCTEKLCLGHSWELKGWTILMSPFVDIKLWLDKGLFGCDCYLCRTYDAGCPSGWSQSCIGSV